MIARIWTAKATQAQAPVYAGHFESQVLSALREVDGYAGAKLLERATPDGIEIVVITFWQSLDAIRKFAGAELEKAVVSDEVIPLLLRYDRQVIHYEVVVEDEV